MTVKDVINEWDPINLLAHAPSDEYHTEIDAITKALMNCDEINNLADKLMRIFTEAFDGTFVSSKQDSLDVARKLLLVKQQSDNNETIL